MVMYSEFNLNSDLGFNLGYSHVGLIGLLIAVNMANMIKNSYLKLKAARRKAKYMKSKLG